MNRLLEVPLSRSLFEIRGAVLGVFLGDSDRMVAARHDSPSDDDVPSPAPPRRGAEIVGMDDEQELNPSDDVAHHAGKRETELRDALLRRLDDKTEVKAEPRSRSRSPKRRRSRSRSPRRRRSRSGDRKRQDGDRRRRGSRSPERRRGDSRDRGRDRDRWCPALHLASASGPCSARVADCPLVIDSGLVGPLWEGFRESRRCSTDTYPVSYITELLVYED